MAPVISFFCNRNLPHPVPSEPSPLLTQLVDHMDFPFRVVDSVGIVEPAVIGIPLLAVHHGVRVVIGLRQLVPVLHCNQVKVAALLFACFHLLTGAKCPALDTQSGKDKECC